MINAAWYFDFVSPFAYLQFMRLDNLAEELNIKLKPVLLSGLLKHWGQKRTGRNRSKASVCVSLLQVER